MKKEVIFLISSAILLISISFILAQNSGGSSDGTTQNNIVCIEIYDPVCGTNNLTYSNSCYAGKANVSIQCEQACPCPVPDPTPIKCSDGTLYNNCSITKPLYCKEGRLINSCSICGCPQDGNEYICQIDGSCKIKEPEPIKKCSDGTLYNQCSITKPLFCNDGILINKCSVCGCPIDREYICQEDGSCKLKSPGPSICGDFICDSLSETPRSCPEDCITMTSSFYQGTTQQEATIIFSEYGLILVTWWDNILAGVALGNRFPPKDTEIKEDNLEKDPRTLGKTSSSLYSSASVVPDGKAESILVLLQYGIGQNYNNTNKFSPYGFHENSIWRTSFVKGGALKLSSSSTCFYYSYSLDNANFAIYLAKPAVVIDGFDREGNVNGVEALEFVSSPEVMPLDGFLPNLYHPTTTEICLEPNVYNDEQLEGFFKCIGGCLYVSEGASETCNLACKNDIYYNKGEMQGRGRCDTSCNIDEIPLSTSFGGPIDGCSSQGGSPKEETCCCKGCLSYCSAQFNIDLKGSFVESGTSLDSLNIGCLSGYSLIEQNGEKYCLKNLDLDDESGNFNVKLTQDQATEKAIIENEIQTINSVDLQEQNDKSVYLVEGSKTKRILFLIPVNVNIKTTLDAKTGEIISTKKPWWSFLAW